MSCYACDVHWEVALVFSECHLIGHAQHHSTDNTILIDFGWIKVHSLPGRQPSDEPTHDHHEALVNGLGFCGKDDFSRQVTKEVRTF